MLVEGPAGIGKSRLIDELGDPSRPSRAERAHRPRRPLEQDFAFGVARQLFEPLLGDPPRRERLLAGAAASAAPVFDVPGAVDPGTVDGSFAALHGLYWLAANVAEDAPLLLVVDDLHWCDRPSLRFIGYLARRLAGSHFLSRRKPPHGRARFDPVLSPSSHEPRSPIVVPRPLSERGSPT